MNEQFQYAIGHCLVAICLLIIVILFSEDNRPECHSVSQQVLILKDTFGNQFKAERNIDDTYFIHLIKQGAVKG